MGNELRAPLKSLNTIECCDGSKSLRGLSIVPRAPRHKPPGPQAQCRETPGSRTAARLIAVVFPVWPRNYLQCPQKNEFLFLVKFNEI